MTAELYQASPIKRTRATKAEARREALLDIIEVGRPMIVRQVFYQATVRGLVEKAERATARCRRISRSCAGQNCLGAAAMTRPRCRPRTLFLKEDSSHETARRRWQDRPANSLIADVD